jgi:BirA family biotin operon repressor/biotin-[acetyl-CoA-carboxylase] ligase
MPKRAHGCVRKWESPVGNLYCSTVVDMRPGDPAPSSLSFVTALAVCDLLKDHLPSNESIMLKWPNDILVNEAKICGILLERVSAKIVVGIGINIVSAPELPDRKTISLQAANGRNQNDASQILDYLIPEFQKRLKQWRMLGLKSILHDWQSAAHRKGASLLVSDAEGEKIRGEYMGLNEDGALRLRKADGTLIVLHAGDVEMDQQTPDE